MNVAKMWEMALEKKKMSIKLAKIIKRVRMKENNSWSDVSYIITKEFCDVPQTNQFLGMWLCKEAGKVLGKKVD